VALDERQGDWLDWVSAAETYHWCDKNPLINYLNLYGADAGFVADSHRSGYDERFDYVSLMLRQSWAFRRAVIRLLSANGPVRKIAGNPSQAHDVAKMEETLAAISERVPIIAQPVLWNQEARMTGVPDLLVRSDVLAGLLNLHPPLPRERGRENPQLRELGREYHYVVVEIKFTTVHVLKDGTASLEHLPHMLQNHIYNEAVGKMQGFTPAASYLLGRDLFFAPARVDHTDPELGRLAAEAAAWVRRLRKEGASWQVLPVPTVPELRPNLKSRLDLEWHAAAHEIAIAQRDLTLLPYVGVDRRARALASGITRWDDPTLTAHTFGLADSAEGRRIDAVLRANTSTGDQAVFPVLLTSNIRHWQQCARVERFVSLQSVNDQADDFSRLPDRGGTAMVFMITWGFVDRKGLWQTGQLVARDLSLGAEAELKAAWKAQLDRWADAERVRVQDIRLIHWGNSEVPLPDLNWLDLLDVLIYEEAVAVRGAFGFGLAEIARALHALGLVETALPDRPVGTLEAMAGAWSAAREATERQIPLDRTVPMQIIANFSRDLCRSMMETLAVLRQRAEWSLGKAA
jgi:hypothetical protein